MNNISIDTIMPELKNYKTSKISIKSICETLEDKKPEQLNIRMLEEKNKLERKKLQRYYLEVYSKCVKKINETCAFNKTDLIFTLPIKNINNYSAQECMEYIINELEKNNVAAIKLDHNSLFITWKYS